MKSDSKSKFSIPTREGVAENNQLIFDKLNQQLGFVPNLYAYYAKSNSALGDYLLLQNRKSTLSPVEREVISLVVSQVNECAYCLPAHTAIAKMLTLSDEQIINIRKAQILHDQRMDALAKLVKEITITRGRPAAILVERFFDVGYTEENLVDVVMVIGDKIISNYLHGITQLPIDFPAVPKLDENEY